MNSFVHVDQPSNHPGVRRVETVLGQWRVLLSNLNASRSLAALLLAAMVSALMVAADQFMTAHSDGGTLSAWIVLWTVAFTAMALFGNIARAMASRLMRAWRLSAKRRAAARADAQLLAYAQFDPRVLQEIQAVMSRAEQAESAV